MILPSLEGSAGVLDTPIDRSKTKFCDDDVDCLYKYDPLSILTITIDHKTMVILSIASSSDEDDDEYDDDDDIATLRASQSYLNGETSICDTDHDHGTSNHHPNNCNNSIIATQQDVVHVQHHYESQEDGRAAVWSQLTTSPYTPATTTKVVGQQHRTADVGVKNISHVKNVTASSSISVQSPAFAMHEMTTNNSKSTTNSHRPGLNLSKVRQHHQQQNNSGTSTCTNDNNIGKELSQSIPKKSVLEASTSTLESPMVRSNKRKISNTQTLQSSTSSPTEKGCKITDVTIIDRPQSTYDVKKPQITTNIDKSDGKVEMTIKCNENKKKRKVDSNSKSKSDKIDMEVLNEKGTIHTDPVTATISITSTNLEATSNNNSKADKKKKKTSTKNDDAHPTTITDNNNLPTITLTTKPKNVNNDKKKKLTFQDQVMVHMLNAFKPFTLRTLTDEMKTTSESSVNFVLLSLIDKGLVIQKDFTSTNGRVKTLYWANHNRKAKEVNVDTFVDVIVSKEDRDVAQQTMIELRNKLIGLRNQYQQILQQPSNDDLTQLIVQKENELQEIVERRNAIQQRIHEVNVPHHHNPIQRKGFPQQKQIQQQLRCPIRLKKQINILRDEWKKRKMKCMDFIEQLSDGLEKKVKDVVQLLDIDTDEMNHVTIPTKYSI